MVMMMTVITDQKKMIKHKADVESTSFITWSDLGDDARRHVALSALTMQVAILFVGFAYSQTKSVRAASVFLHPKW